MDLEQFMKYGTSLVSRRYFYFRFLLYLYINCLYCQYKLLLFVLRIIYLASAKVGAPDVSLCNYSSFKIHVVNFGIYS